MSATLEFDFAEAFTLTAELYPYGSDTIANTGGDSCTEQTNDKGRYTATIAEVLAGQHHVKIKSGSAVVARFHVLMIDGVTCRCRSEPLTGNGYRNTALNNFEFTLISSADHVTPLTGATGITATRSIDGGAFASCSGTVTEVGNGVYKINLSAADRNGNVVTLKFNVSGADERKITFVLSS